MGGRLAGVGSQAGELKMMSFFEDVPIPPSRWLLDRGTRPHHFLSKLAPSGAQYLCPVFSDCSWQVSSDRVTRRNHSAPFCLPQASVHLSLAFWNSPIELPDLACDECNTSFLNIQVCLCFFLSCFLRPSVLPRKDSSHAFPSEKGGIHSLPTLFLSRLQGIAPGFRVLLCARHRGVRALHT